MTNSPAPEARSRITEIRENLEAWVNDTRFQGVSPGPVDQLWCEHTNNPPAAQRAFQEHVGSYSRFRPSSRGEGVPPRIQVACAVGGLAVAAEAGDKWAAQAFKEIQSQHGKRSLDNMGELIINQMASPRGLGVDDENPGSALALYLTASALERDNRYTVWQKTSADYGREAAQHLASKAGRAARGRLPGSRGRSDTASSQRNSSNSSSDVMGFRTTDMRELARSYLRAEMAKSPYNLGDFSEHALLTAAAGAVAVRMGAIPKLYAEPTDRMSAQLLEDFAENCARIARSNDPHQIVRTIGSDFHAGFNFRDLYALSVLLLARSGKRVTLYKPPRTNPVTRAQQAATRARDSLKTTTVKVPNSGRPLREDLTRGFGDPSRRELSGDMRRDETTYGGTTGQTHTESLGDRVRAGLKGLGPVHSARAGAATRGSETRREVAEQRSPLLSERLIHPPASLRTLLAEHGRSAYDWSTELAAVALRSSGRTTTASEQIFLGQHPDIIHRVVLRQHYEQRIPDRIREGGGNDSVLVSAIELQRWLQRVASGSVQSEHISPAAAQKYEASYWAALTAHARREYGISPDAPLSYAMVRTLSELTAAQRTINSIEDNPSNPMVRPVARSFGQRILAAMRGADSVVEKHYLARVQRQMESIAIEQLPEIAQRRYHWLITKTGYNGPMHKFKQWLGGLQ